MGCSFRVLRAVAAILLLLGFISFLFLGIVANPETKTATTGKTTSSGNLRDFKLTGERNSVRKDCDLNCVSKRRVPNGADPIHNRGAGKFRVPSGRT